MVKWKRIAPTESGETHNLPYSMNYRHAEKTTSKQGINPTPNRRNHHSKNSIGMLSGILIMTFLFCLLPASVSAGFLWDIENVEVGEHTGQFYFPSIAYDTDDRPCISYYDGADDCLKYACRNGTSWEIETVDANGDVGYKSSLAFDKEGNPAISYTNLTDDSIKFAWKNASTWQCDTIIPFADIPTSLAFDPEGNPVIAYINATPTYHLACIWRNGTSWEHEDVDMTQYSGEYPSLAFNSEGNPAISYFNSGTLDLRYAWKNGTQWELETIDSEGYTGEYSSLAFDTAGRPAVSYYDLSEKNLKYAVKNESGWEIITVDEGPYAGKYTSLSFDSDGHPGISYIDTYNDEVKYALKTGGMWITGTVATTGLGSYGYGTASTSSAFNSAEKPTIAYFDAYNAIKFASGTLEGTLVVTSAPEAGWIIQDGTNTTLRTNTTFSLPEGEYTISVSNQDYLPSENITVTLIPYEPIQLCFLLEKEWEIPLSEGWNLISVPSAHPNITCPPEVGTPLYGYDGNQYVAITAEEMEGGKGYWCSAVAPATLRMTGVPILKYQRSVQAGWNLIGGVDGTIPMYIYSLPYGLISNLYTYENDTYTNPVELAQGKGYWVALTEDAQIVVNNPV